MTDDIGERTGQADDRRPQTSTSSVDLLNGPIPSTLARLAAPTVVGIASVTVFNLVDTAFAARLGETELAALGYTFPVVALLGAVAGGLGMATTARLSRGLGAGDLEQARRLARDAVLLAVLVVAALSMLGVATIDPLFTALGADPDELVHVREYMTIWYLGMVMLVVPMVSNGAIRATGDTVSPAVIMVIAAVANIVLDPILMFGLGPIPALGLEGAAIASVAARAITLAASGYLLAVRRRLVAFSVPSLGEFVGNVRQLGGLAVPAAASGAITPVSLGALTAIVATFGSTQVAALAAGGRVAMLLGLAAMATGAGLVPFVGQNLGADRPDRIRSAITIAVRTNIALAALAWVIVALARGPIAESFTQTDATAGALESYLLIAAAGTIAAVVPAIVTAALNGLQRAGTAAAITAVRVVVLVPAALIGARLDGPRGIWVAFTAVEIVTAVLSVAITRRLVPTSTTAISASIPPLRRLQGTTT